MNKIIATLTLSLATTFSFGANSSASSHFNLAGNYHCTVHDQSGKIFHSTVTYTLDTKNSSFTEGYSSYHFKGVSQFGTVYLGEAILRGNSLAIYTYNAFPKKPNDIGLEISTVTQNTDEKGQTAIMLNSLLYDPLDKNGGSAIAISCLSSDNTQNS